VYRDPDDIALLTELAGVLDQTVTEAGLTSGTYLVLRELDRSDTALAVTALAGRLHADPEEIADLAGRLIDADLVTITGGRVGITEVGAARVTDLEVAANEAMRDYVMDRPHTATVYGLVAAMQSGRFTVEDLIEFLNEGPTDDEGS
jgi:hypothetical protein